MSTVTFYAIGEIADTSIGFAVIVAPQPRVLFALPS